MVSLKVFSAFGISSLPGNSLATGRYGGAACSTCTTWLDGFCEVPGAWHYFPADIEISSLRGGGRGYGVRGFQVRVGKDSESSEQ